MAGLRAIELLGGNGLEAWQEIESERAMRGMPNLEAAGRPVRYLASAATAGLGTDDPEKLSVVTV